MPRQGRPPRLRLFMVNRPQFAERLFTFLGRERLARIARRRAMRASRRAFEHVPFFRDRYTRAGFDARRMRRLTWSDFLQLPVVGKADTVGVPHQDLLDDTISFPAGDALITRSSGTTTRPAMIPTGWDEYYVTRAIIERLVRRAGADRTKSVILLAYGVDGNPAAGGIMIRVLFDIKQRTQWPFEVCAAGETPDTIISFLRYYAENGFESLYLIAFPGTMERLLDRLQELEAGDPGAGVDWRRFRTKRVQFSGQVVSRELRARVTRTLQLGERDLDALDILLGSSDAGQIIARSTPFTRWLELYLDEHPEVAEHLGIPAEHRAKPLMEFVPALSIFLENDPEMGLLLTSWKHWPLIRYRSNDLAWLCQAHDLVRVLNRAAKGWRKDFAGYGYGRRHVPRSPTLGMVLGRVDDSCIINGANVSPDILREALAAAGILPLIHHFKHSADPTSANIYRVYLELPDERDVMTRDLLAAQWQPSLFEALIAHPAATDLQNAHRGTPIELKLFVRSLGEDEFAGDAARNKKRYLAPSPSVGARSTQADPTVPVGVRIGHEGEAAAELPAEHPPDPMDA